MVRQTGELGDDIPGNVSRLVEVELTVVVLTDDKFYGILFRSTKACHQGCVGIVEYGAPSDFFGRLGHLLVDEGPLLDLSLEFLPLALLYFGIFYMF